MKRIIACVLLLCCLSACCAAQAEGKQRVYLNRAGDIPPFDENQETFDLYVCPLMGADCMVLLCGGQTMLVDMGKANNYDTIRGVLTDLGVDHIDIAFNTHPHDDHLGSMTAILADYPAGQFMTAFPEDYTADDVIQKRVIKALHAADVPVIHVEDGDRFPLGGAQMTVIRQTKYKYSVENPNPLSAMLMIQFGECKALLCADVIAEAQKYISDIHDLDADLFKLPHHALNHVYREFLENISPEYVFICHGYMDTQEAQAQLNKHGIPHDFATWGTIHLSTNGEYWIVDQDLNEMGQRCVQRYRDGQ